jgi:RNA polymerase sigma-70 factor (ECF subfamily)
VQDAFTDAWHKLPRLREPAAFPGWLLAIARHRAIDAARRRPTLDPAADLAIDPPPRLEAAAALPDTYLPCGPIGSARPRPPLTVRCARGGSQHTVLTRAMFRIRRSTSGDPAAAADASEPSRRSPFAQPMRTSSPGQPALRHDRTSGDRALA